MDQNLHHLRLYSNRMAMGLRGADWATYDFGDRLKLNIVKTVIDAAVAQIATTRTRPMYLTREGNPKEQKQGRLRGKFALGQFSSLKQYDIGLDIFRDAGIFGTGFEKIVPLGSRVHAERVIAEDVIVDDAECRTGTPRQMFHVKEVDREVLKAEYPDAAPMIDTATSYAREASVTYREQADSVVSVAEAMHLPSNDDADDGRRVICVSNATLVDEKWDGIPTSCGERTFPIIPFRWATVPLGYFGMGLAEELTSIQVEINYILQKVQKLMTLATSQVWVESGSNVNVSRMNNDDFSVNTFKGRPPVFMTVAAVSPEYFNQLDRLWNRAFEVSGISQLNATAQKPAGVDSGKAMRTYSDIASKRFLHVQQRWEQFHVDAAEHMFDAARQVYEANGAFKTIAQSRRGIEELRFEDVNLERDKYIVQVHPVAFLPDTPAGQMQTIKEFGDISPDIQQSMISNLQYPDLDDAVSLATAPLEYADLMISRILEEGEYRPPNSFMDLDLAIRRGTLSLLRAEIGGVSEEHLGLLRQWLDEAVKLKGPPPAPPMPPNAMPQQPMMPGPDAGAVPMQ